MMMTQMGEGVPLGETFNYFGVELDAFWFLFYIIIFIYSEFCDTSLILLEINVFV